MQYGIKVHAVQDERYVQYRIEVRPALRYAQYRMTRCMGSALQRGSACAGRGDVCSCMGTSRLAVGRQGVVGRHGFPPGVEAVRRAEVHWIGRLAVWDQSILGRQALSLCPSRVGPTPRFQLCNLGASATYGMPPLFGP